MGRTVKLFLHVCALIISLAVTASAESNFLYALSHLESGHTAISAFSVGPDGRLTEIAGSPFLNVLNSSGVMLAAEEILVSPVGNFLYVANGGHASSSISVFSINPNTGALTPVPGSPFKVPTPERPLTPYFAPKSLAVTPDNRFLFVADDQGEKIASFKVAPDGALTHIESRRYPMNPTRMKVSPDGKRLFIGGGFYNVLASHVISPDGRIDPTPASAFILEEDRILKYLEMNRAGTLLFAPQLGLNVFNVSSEGVLTLAPGSPVRYKDNEFTRVLLNPSENLLFASNPLDATISVYGVNADGRVPAVPRSTLFIGDPQNEDRYPEELDINQDGTLLYVATADDTIYVFSVTASGFLLPVPGSPFKVPAGVEELAAYPAKGSPAAATFDLCLQDESNGSTLQIDPATGDYKYTACSGFSIGGRGSITRKGRTITLQHSGNDRRVSAKIDTSVKRGSASVQTVSQPKTLTITDKNIGDNSCECGSN